MNLSAFNIDDLKITVKDAGGDKGTLGAKTKKSATEITVQYTFPSSTDVPNLETLTVEAKLFDAVLKETFLPVAIDGTILKRWNKDSAITEVKIPSYITAISATGVPIGAFSECVNIRSVTFTLPSGLTKIGIETFSGCSKLAHITIPENVTLIDREAFSNCDSLTNITIPDRVTRINDWAFSPCAALASVTIGAGVTHIGQEVFKNCSDLTNIVIQSDKVTAIGNGAFSDIKHGAHFTVKTEAIKTLIKNSTASITDEQIEVKP